MNRRQGFILLVAFVLYLLIGGAVFMTFERNAEDDRTTGLEINILRDFKNFLIGNDSRSQSGMLPESLETYVDAAYTDFLYSLQRNSTWRDWSFSDSVFFSLTVVTTIGYGNMSPSTSSGRFFCIFYALFGIPMAGILLAAIGDFFSCKLLKAHERTKETRSSSPRLALVINTVTYLIPGFILFLFLPAGVFMALEEWTFLEAFYYAFITLTTIGFGDYVAGNSLTEMAWLYKLGVMAWIVFGLGYLAMILNFIAKAMKSKHVQKIEMSVAKNLKNTQLALNKEMLGLVKQVNDFYTNKVKLKVAMSERGKLNRTNSCPSMNRPTSSRLKRSVSSGSIEADNEVTEQSVNFIFDLAMALVCGDMDVPGQQEGGGSVSSGTKVGRMPSVRQGSIAQLMSAMTLFPSIVKRNASVGNLENNMLSAFHGLQTNSNVDKDKHSQFEKSLFSVSSNGLTNRRSSDHGHYFKSSNCDSGIVINRTLSHPVVSLRDDKGKDLVAKLENDFDSGRKCRWTIGSSTEDIATKCAHDDAKQVQQKCNVAQSASGIYRPEGEVAKVIEEEQSDNCSCDSVAGSTVASTTDQSSRETVVIDIDDDADLTRL